MPLRPGSDAPDFRLPAAGGAFRSLADLAGPDGSPTLLVFFKIGCPTCKLAFPVYGELERRFGDAAAVVAVSQDPLAATVPWLESQGFAGPVVDDDSDRYQVSASYGVTSVPTLVMVEDGKVVDASEAWDRERVNDWARLLGERLGRDTSAVSTEADGRPAFKPG